MGRKHSPETIRRIVEMARAGKLDREIRAELGVSRTTIWRWTSRAGLTGRESAAQQELRGEGLLARRRIDMDGLRKSVRCLLEDVLSDVDVYGYGAGEDILDDLMALIREAVTPA